MTAHADLIDDLVKCCRFIIVIISDHWYLPRTHDRWPVLNGCTYFIFTHQRQYRSSSLGLKPPLRIDTSPNPKRFQSMQRQETIKETVPSIQNPSVLPLPPPKAQSKDKEHRFVDAEFFQELQPQMQMSSNGLEKEHHRRMHSLRRVVGTNWNHRNPSNLEARKSQGISPSTYMTQREKLEQRSRPEWWTITSWILTWWALPVFMQSCGTLIVIYALR
jgi:hypothetical protein